MSFEKFASRIADRTEAQDLTQDVAAERARQPFNEAWLREIYPAWQGPLNKAKRIATVTRCGAAPSIGAPSVSNLNELLAKLERDDWRLTQEVFVESAAGVTASVAYLFAGVPSVAVLARVPITKRRRSPRRRPGEP
jgi:hypothetical protein